MLCCNPNINFSSNRVPSDDSDIQAGLVTFGSSKKHSRQCVQRQKQATKVGREIS